MIAPAFRLTALAAVVALALCGVAAAQSDEEGNPPSAAPPSTSPIQGGPNPPGGPNESPGEEGPPEGGPPPEGPPPPEGSPPPGGSPAAAICPRNLAGRAVQGLQCSCAPQQMSGPVWGSIRYTADSSICRAAVHAGVIPPAGGVVTVWSGPGCGRFVGTSRNGVNTGNWGGYHATYAFQSPLPRCVGQVAVVPPPEGGAGAPPCPRNMAGRAAQGLQCSCAPQQMSGAVWGSLRYTADSSICRAAVHAGVITPQGGVVRVWSGPGCGRFVGSFRNGVRTGNWGGYGATYAFQSPLPRCFSQAAVVPPPGGGQEDTDGSPGAPPPPAGCDPSFGGKYATLLRRIYVPQDVRQYGRCRDYGRYTGNSWAGHYNLPPGYWTYRYPHWYIWNQRTR